MKLCEIFTTGLHKDSKGRERLWTTEDLDKICANFKEKNPDVPICIGHPTQTAPAYGWVNSLQRIGEKLYCDYKQVQEEFKEAVNKGLFKTRSISVNPETMQLRHIAFLGAQAPAIKGMEQFCFADENEDFSEYDFDSIPKEGEYMDEELTKEIETKNSKIAELKAKIEEMESEKQNQEFSELVDKWVEKGNVLPKDRDCVMNILKACNGSDDFLFSDSEGIETTKPALEAVKELFGSIKSMDFSDPTNEKNLDNTQVSDFSEFKAEDWKTAIDTEISKAAQNGQTINPKEALARIKKG